MSTFEVIEGGAKRDKIKKPRVVKEDFYGDADKVLEIKSIARKITKTQLRLAMLALCNNTVNRI